MAYTNTKTPLVYYGGKTSIMNHLLPLVPVHSVYTEVFAGGAALFWHKEPTANETLNDTMDVVLNFYQILKSNFKQLKKLIDSTLASRSLYRAALNTIRLHAEHVPVDRVHLAWAFWFCVNFAHMNKLGGGIKYTNDQSTSTPTTLRRKKSEFTDWLVKRIENVYLENNDALTVLAARNFKNSFHYIDPPYPGADQGHYNGYTWEMFEQLLKWCAIDCKGSFLLSNYNSEMLTQYAQQYGWAKKEVTHELRKSRKSSGKDQNMFKTEVLIYNYVPNGTAKLF